VDDCFGKFAGGAGVVEWRRDLGNPDENRYVELYGVGNGQWVAGPDGLGARVDHGEYNTSDADGYLDQPGCGERWKLVQRNPGRKRRNAGLFVVDCFGSFACWIDDVEWWRDLGHADGKWDCDVYGRGHGQWIACTDSIGARVDCSECGAEHVDDYIDEFGGGEERNLVQRDAERERRNTGLHVDGKWEFARRVDYVGRWCDLGNADGNRYIDLLCDGE
jgi:hypothetical protein